MITQPRCSCLVASLDGSRRQLHEKLFIDPLRPKAKSRSSSFELVFFFFATIQVLSHLSGLTNMSHDLVRLREEIERCTKDYGFCPNRIWQIDSQISDPECHLTGLLRGFTEKLSGSLVGALAHEEHSACTFDYCEFSNRNFTAVQQYHEPVFSEAEDGESIGRQHRDKSVCSPLKDLFREDTLFNAVNAGMPTAWHFNGRTLIRHPQPFMAISHVWSDGTGSGPWGPGHVNECLYIYFKRLAERFQCEGIWWDTLCIPQDKVARGKALNIMHLNYEYARVTLVHDRFLRKIPFTEPQTACMAIILSSWFTRGWTALELAKSQKVKVIFKDCIKDLDEDILGKAGDIPAAAVIRNLRTSGISGIEDLIRTLGPRYTSWPSDRAIIAGLLAGIDTLQSTSGETFQRDIYQRILLKIGTISHGHLFHTSATMSDGFSWFPTNLFQLPHSAIHPELTINDSGEVIGTWKVVSPHCVQLQDCVWDVSHPLIEARVRHVLVENRDKHVLLVVPAEGNIQDNNVQRALLVEVFRCGSELPGFKCQFVGSMRFHTALTDSGQSKDMVVNIGNTRDCQRLSQHEIAWDIIDQYEAATDTRIEARQDDRLHISLEEGWTICHHAAWVDDWSLVEVESDPGPYNQTDSLGRRPIHLAAERGHHEIVLQLIAMGMDPSCPDGTGQTPLHRAAWGGSLRSVECLLENGSRARARDKFGNSALHVAADMGFEDVVYCLCGKVDVMIRGRNGLTPLHYAAMSGHEAICAYFLHMGAEIDAVDRAFGWTPLHCAADNGHAETVRRLLAHKAAVEAQDKIFKWTALHFAEMNGNEEVARLLTDKKASQHAKDKNGWTPQHFAKIRLSTTSFISTMSKVSWTLPHLLAIDGCGQVTRLLLDTEKGQGISQGTIRSHILHEAANRGYHRAVNALFRGRVYVRETFLCCELDIPTIFESLRTYSKLLGQFTPLHLAAHKGYSKTCWTLVENGAKINQESIGEEIWADRLTALHLAALGGCPRTVSSLLKQGADLNHQTARGYTALHFAAIGGHKDVVEKLLDERASIYVQSADKFSALAYAVRGGYDTIVDMLLDKHPSVDEHSNAHGAMFLAILLGRVEIFSRLIQRGAPVEARINRLTLLHHAARYGQEKIVEILLSHHADVHATVPDDLGGITGFKGRLETHRRATPLHLAAEGGHEIVTQMLLNADANVHLRNYDQLTPLHLAAREGHSKIVLQLLDKGAAIHGDSQTGTTPLHLAVRGAGTTVLNKFLKGNSDDAEDVVDHRFTKTVEELLRHHADPNAADNLGRTALHYAAESGWEEIAMKLIEGGASADSKSKDGQAPRRLALQAGHDTLAKALGRHEKNLFQRLRR